MFGDIGKMLKLAGELKTKLPEMKAALAAREFSAEAGGGAVRATVNGSLALVGIEIDRKLLAGDPDASGEKLEKLIKAAVSSAQDQAAEAAAQAMKELTGGMEIPGLEGLL